MRHRAVKKRSKVKVELENEVVGYVLSKVPEAERSTVDEPQGIFVAWVSDIYVPYPLEDVVIEADKIAEERSGFKVSTGVNYNMDVDFYIASAYVIKEEMIGWTVESSVDGSTLLRCTPIVYVDGVGVAVPEVRGVGGRSYTARKHTKNMLSDVSSLHGLVDANIASAKEWREKLKNLVGKPVEDSWTNSIKKLNLPAKVLPEWIVKGTDPEGDLKSNYIHIVRGIHAIVSDKRKMDLLRSVATTLHPAMLVESILED